MAVVSPALAPARVHCEEFAGVGFGAGAVEVGQGQVEHGAGVAGLGGLAGPLEEARRVAVVTLVVDPCEPEHGVGIALLGLVGQGREVFGTIHQTP